MSLPPRSSRQPNFAEALSLDADLLASRFSFLSARAERHKTTATEDEEGTSALHMHIACEATLLRDAGAIALILGEFGEAKAKFRRVGELWLRLGFYEGLLFLQLGGAQISKLATNWISSSLKPEGKAVENLPRYARAGSRSPRQLISLVQAVDDSKSHVSELREQALEQLQLYRAYPLGSTKTPLAQYLWLLQSVRQADFSFRHAEFSFGPMTTLAGMSIRRAELITGAQEDKYHWRMALKPSEIVDFDLFVLGLIALKRDPDFFLQVRSIVGRYGNISSLPFDLAMTFIERP